MKKTNIRSRITSLRSVIPAALRVLAADHVGGGRIISLRSMIQAALRGGAIPPFPD